MKRTYDMFIEQSHKWLC